MNQDSVKTEIKEGIMMNLFIFCLDKNQKKKTLFN